MDMQELQPGQIDSLIPHHSAEDWSLKPTETAVPDMPTEQHSSHVAAIDFIVAQRLGQLLLIDSDDRLDFMQEANPKLTGEELVQIASITHGWLDDEARDRMRAVVRECHKNGRCPRDALLNWYTDEEFHRLIDPLQEAQISDLQFAVCYALSEAHDTAYAAYFIHINRASGEVNSLFGNQTREENAGGIGFLSSR